MNERKPWSKEELILAINLYCKIPFGKIHIRNPEIIELSKLLGRTPGSVSYKLANFASLDPALVQKGAEHVSKLDREVWGEFYDNWEEMAFQSEDLLAKKKGRAVNEVAGSEENFEIGEGKSKESIVKARVNQGFFRKMVLAAYDNTCCITGLCISDLLIASHIIPWSIDKKNRLNPRNGLCLNAFHDRAFDKGYIAISDDFKVLVSPRIQVAENISKSGFELILKYKNKKINLPKRFTPARELLSRHRTEIFR